MGEICRCGAVIEDPENLARVCLVCARQMGEHEQSLIVYHPDVGRLFLRLTLRGGLVIDADVEHWSISAAVRERVVRDWLAARRKFRVGGMSDGERW